MAAPIRLERDGAVAVIVLDNGRLNLFTEEAFSALSECIAAIEASDARATVWRAEGEIFSGGVDVNVFQKIVDSEPDRAGELFDPLLGTVQRLEALEMPTLALLHGVCLTAAWEIALGCDLIWAAESMQAGLVEKVVGLTPGAGGTQRLAERCGPGRAREFVFTGELHDAATLERWNAINRVVADDALLDEGMAFARALAAGPTRAHNATKRIVRGYLEGGIDRADEITPEVAGELFETEDLQNAVRSFLAEGPGKASFEGR